MDLSPALDLDLEYLAGGGWSGVVDGWWKVEASVRNKPKTGLRRYDTIRSILPYDTQEILVLILTDK